MTGGRGSFAVPGTVSPTKRTSSRPTPHSLSRPTTPSLLRRPASSASMRSPTPLARTPRPMTPSWYAGSQQQHQQQHHNHHSSASAAMQAYSGKIKVSVRVKPSSNQERIWTIDPLKGGISNRELGDFTFDNVYDGGVANGEVYDRSVRELVEKVMTGFHGTVFAYGMTGSGKTFSMQGSVGNPGIIPQSVQSIFEHIRHDNERSYAVKVGYLEIYNEHLNDLLSNGTSQEEIKLRDDSNRGVKALGLTEVVVTSPEQLLSTIGRGDALRKTEGTEFNSRSSRSHAVVQITIDSAPSGAASTTGRNTMKHSSTLYLCDLAGSERAVSQSERRKEGSYINKSLLTLGTVIARLSSGATAGGHIPYRDSKLTRLLQPALSGKSLVSVLCTIQTAGSTGSYMETVSTLRFAARAKNVVVNVKRNDEVTDSKDMVERLMQQVAAQKLEIQQLKSGVMGSGYMSHGSSPLGNGPANSHMVSQVAQLEAENRILNERVEHLTRLCDDSRLEEVLGFDGLASDDGMSDVTDNESMGRQHSQQIEEYKSYVSHLEKLLYQQEFSHRTNSLINGSSTASSMSSSHYTTSTAASSIDNMSRSSVSSRSSSSSTHQEMLLQDLRDELDELRESNADKDRIIAALRSLNKRKENLMNPSSQSTPYSSQYARYYNFSGGNGAVSPSPSLMYSENEQDVTITESRSGSPLKSYA